MLHPILYKQDSKNKTRTWQVEQEGSLYRTISGLEDGEKVISEWTKATPKNVGQSNETTGERQALREINAMYEKKEKTGYSKDINTSGTKYVEPMLAHKWDGKLIIGHQRMFSQPKLDGVRCIATKDGLFSRKGEKFHSVPHISKALEEVFNKHPNLILDGELYNHDLKDNFNKIVSLVKKKKPNATDLKESEELIQYHIYDMVDVKPFNERSRFLPNEIKHGGSIHLVATKEIETVKDLDSSYEEYLSDGYEGQMIRLNHHYQHKRSQSLLKRKEFQDAEFTIIQVEEGIGNRSGMAGRVTCALSDGRTFGAGIKGGIEVNKCLWNTREAIKGCKATIEFFNYTPDGIPRFPVFKAVREDA